MTRDDILSMAQEAGWEMPLAWDESDGFLQRLERFAAIFAAAEREACAKVCEDLRDLQIYADKQEAQNDCAAAIRARGKE